MTLGTTLAETVKEEQAFTKTAAERYALHAKGEGGVAEVEAFEREIGSIQTTLATLIESRVPSKAVQVALKGNGFKTFEMLSNGILKPYGATATREDPMDKLVHNPM